MPRLIRQLILFALVCVLAAGNVNAQQSPVASKQAAEVKAKVGRLSPQAHISIIPNQGEEEFGRFVSSDQEGFVFYDIDRKMTAAIQRRHRRGRCSAILQMNTSISSSFRCL
jgi:hypothetical protein